MNIQTSPESLGRSTAAADERIVREDLAALDHIFLIEAGTSISTINHGSRAGSKPSFSDQLV